MSNRSFIKVQTIVETWNGSTYLKTLGDEVWIDADVIVEVYPLKEDFIYNDITNTKDRKPCKCAFIYRSNAHGHGINGMSTNMIVDEASYHAICKQLGID